ncbi:unnamed protein product, partial [Polarella glacialis]
VSFVSDWTGSDGKAKISVGDVGVVLGPCDNPSLPDCLPKVSCSLLCLQFAFVVVVVVVVVVAVVVVVVVVFVFVVAVV